MTNIINDKCALARNDDLLLALSIDISVTLRLLPVLDRCRKPISMSIGSMLCGRTPIPSENSAEKMTKPQPEELRTEEREKFWVQ